jgi:prolyl-tRNA editing enzyme YbaK/EbsC (Cys-tRNA(Pro) deacylase)
VYNGGGAFQVSLTLPAMVSPWPEAVERVSGFLRQMGVEARVEEFTGGTPTAVDAARAVGCKLGQIVKSLVFDCDGRWVVVLVPGDRRADSAKIASAAGASKARIASPEEVERATGFVAGAVAPFPLPGVDRVFVDHGLLSHKRVWIGAGSPSHMAVLSPADLVRLARAQPMDAVEAAT